MHGLGPPLELLRRSWAALRASVSGLGLSCGLWAFLAFGASAGGPGPLLALALGTSVGRLCHS